MILNPKTGFVSPQFHCIFDDKFDSVKTDKNFSKIWAEKAGLMLKRDEHEEDNDYSKITIPEQLNIPFEQEQVQQEEKESAQEEVLIQEENEEPMPQGQDEQPVNNEPVED